MKSRILFSMFALVLSRGAFAEIIQAPTQSIMAPQARMVQPIGQPIAVVQKTTVFHAIPNNNCGTASCRPNPCNGCMIPQPRPMCPQYGSPCGGYGQGYGYGHGHHCKRCKRRCRRCGHGGYRYPRPWGFNFGVGFVTKYGQPVNFGFGFAGTK